MSVLDKIISLLNEKQIQYEQVVHEYVRTSEEAAKVRGSALDMGAKAIICKADAIPILIAVPGDKKIDFRVFKKTYGVNDLRMATSEEVTALTGLLIGSIPPLGSLFGIRSYYDISIGNKTKVAFNAGDHEVSVFMRGRDLIELEKPIIGSFSA